MKKTTILEDIIMVIMSLFFGAFTIGIIALFFFAMYHIIIWLIDNGLQGIFKVILNILKAIWCGVKGC